MNRTKNRARGAIEAEQNFVLDVQFLILDLLREKGMTKEQLAAALGVSKARVSNMLSADANLTVRSIGRALHALGEAPIIKTTRASGRHSAQDRGAPEKRGTVTDLVAYANENKTAWSMNTGPNMRTRLRLVA